MLRGSSTGDPSRGQGRPIRSQHWRTLVRVTARRRSLRELRLPPQGASGSGRARATRWTPALRPTMPPRRVHRSQSRDSGEVRRVSRRSTRVRQRVRWETLALVGQLALATGRREASPGWSGSGRVCSPNCPTSVARATYASSQEGFRTVAASPDPFCQAQRAHCRSPSPSGRKRRKPLRGPFDLRDRCSICAVIGCRVGDR